ncbi:MAG: hypothetical protein RL885_29255 [Planctomycetota bacterium]
MAIRCLFLIAIIQCLPGCLTLGTWSDTPVKLSQVDVFRTARVRCESASQVDGEEAVALKLVVAQDEAFEGWEAPLEGNRVVLLEPATVVGKFERLTRDPTLIRSLEIGWDGWPETLDERRVGVCLVVGDEEWQSVAYIRPLGDEDSGEDVCAVDLEIRFQEQATERSPWPVTWRVAATPLLVAVDLATLPLQIVGMILLWPTC